jgi:hypothetical protein
VDDLQPLEPGARYDHRVRTPVPIVVGGVQVGVKAKAVAIKGKWMKRHVILQSVCFADVGAAGGRSRSQ